MTTYSSSPEWVDVVPIPQDDGCANPLAAIAYSEQYSEAMSYLRAVMASSERSKRVLKLTEDIIKMNPAHYTVWIYRADTLIALGEDLRRELKWLNSIAMKHFKNFQIWHHRQVIMSHIPELPSNEIEFLTNMFAKDAKNYHVWSYRQWLVRRFDLWDSELPYVEDLLKADVRNNSAWNHRWFIVFARHTNPENRGTESDDAPGLIPETTIAREIEFAKQAIIKAPQNQSPWLYLRGVLRKYSKRLRGCKSFAERIANIEKPDEVRSSHALEFLADVYVEEGESSKAIRALNLLSERYDPIRKNYWDFRAHEILEEASSTTSSNAMSI